MERGDEYRWFGSNGAAHVLSSGGLRIVFAIVLIIIGMKMLGVFSWLHLPL